MTNPTSIILVGVGGFGAIHAETLLDNKAPGVHLVAVIDPYAKNSRIYDRINGSIPIYNQLEDFYATGQTADLVFISSPHFLHYKHCLAALAGGSHVLCEKPLVPTMDEFIKLEQKFTAAGKTLSVAFQWCYSEIILALKARILAGELGRPVFFKGLTSWPRVWKYYKRNNWAGRVTMDDGQPVHDSVVSNACAHHIQNMLFLLGSTMEDSANLQNTYVETYRANDIQSFDTCALRGEVGGAKMMFIASHATNYHLDPIMRYELEKAVIMVNVYDRESVCTIHHHDGRVERLGPAIGDGMVNKFTYTAKAIRGEGDYVCTLRTVKPFTTLIDAIFSQVPTHPFPKSHVVINSEEERTYIPQLHLQLTDCFNHGQLPSEMGLTWANAPTLLTPNI